MTPPDSEKNGRKCLSIGIMTVKNVQSFLHRFYVTNIKVNEDIDNVFFSLTNADITVYCHNK